MYPHLLKIQIAVAAMVAVGGFVLGGNLRAFDICAISVVGAILAFVVVDRLKWFELSGWIANFVLIGILFLSMRDFIGGNSTEKLISVANLLAYLQVALAFQKKTPRLCWQLLVLSILQIVVAAIFNLNFEYWLYFVLYFGVVIVMMTLQNDFAKWTNLKRKHKQDSTLARQEAQVTANSHPATLGKPVAISRMTSNRRLTAAWLLIIPWLAVSIAFAFLLFHSLPRTAQKDWDEAGLKDFTGTGMSKKVKLDHDGVVNLSNTLIFRAKFLDGRTRERAVINGQPYFRGMALNRWTLKDNVTSWEAPYDHVFNWSYQPLLRYRFGTNRAKNAKPISIEYVMEPSVDPLVYAPMPCYRKLRGESEVEFCRDISALTRRRSESTNTITSYVYSTSTFVDQRNAPLNGWPYQPFKFGESFPQMETGSPEYQLLTEFDRDRYPELVDITNKIVAANADADRIELCDAILEHFNRSNRYTYTLDYRNIELDKSIDPIEDFVAGHRTGHCEMYASAMVLMLRSQGIPARYVLGFHGGEYNSLADCYMIHGRHAHAWVEAYVPPKACTQQMFDDGVAGIGGAWITLDPTPPVNFSASNEAIDLARTFWQDYVISPDRNKQDFNGANMLVMSSTRNSEVGRLIDYLVELTKKNKPIQYGLIAMAGMLFMLLAVRSRRFRETGEVKLQRPVTLVRRLLARAAAVISPQLSRFIVGEKSITVPFYGDLERLLAKHYQLKRSHDQTQLEFASQATTAISRHNTKPIERDKIGKILESVTAAFYQQRFSPMPLDNKTVADIENQIKSLEQIIKSS